MRQSVLFTKTRREAPAGEEAKNAKLLIRGGFIHKEMAGVYSFLPLGFRVLNNTIELIRREMDSIGGQELFLSALQDQKIWKQTNRWDDRRVDAWFKTKIKNGSEVGLSFTHEEPLTAIMRDHIRSWRDLPRFVYQFQTKFRNETRAKSGIMRTREFMMKDLYSFCRTNEEHESFYEKAKESYRRIFDAAGIGNQTHLTFASGGSFSRYSHEFQTTTDAGEDIIHLCETCDVAVNDEIIAEQKKCPRCGNERLVRKTAVEVGNIFSLGTRFSEAFDLSYADEDGVKHPVIMGSYGIGPARLIGTVVETLSDEKGVVWPKTIAPFALHLVLLSGTAGSAEREAEKLYRELTEKGIEILFDDRKATAGEKFADADLIGVPLRVVVSEKTVSAGKIEVRDRATGKSELVPSRELMKLLPLAS